MFRRIINVSKKIQNGEQNQYQDDLNKLQYDLKQIGITQFLNEEIRLQQQQDEISLKKLERVDFDILEYKLKRIHLDIDDNNLERYQKINEGIIDLNEKKMYEFNQEQDNIDQNETSTLEDEDELQFSGIQNLPNNNNNNNDNDDELDDYSQGSSIQLIEIGDLSYDYGSNQQYIQKNSISDTQIRKRIKKLKFKAEKIKQTSTSKF